MNEEKDPTRSPNERKNAIMVAAVSRWSACTCLLGERGGGGINIIVDPRPLYTRSTLPTYCGPNIIANEPKYPLVSPSIVLKTTG